MRVNDEPLYYYPYEGDIEILIYISKFYRFTADEISKRVDENGRIEIRGYKVHSCLFKQVPHGKIIYNEEEISHRIDELPPNNIKR